MYGFRPTRVPQVLVVVALAALAVLGQAGRAAASAATTSATPAPVAGEASARWAWPLSRDGGILLGFGSGYASGAQTRTHMGCDLAAEKGDSVLSPASAVVAFVGEVPSGNDRRLLVVTLQTPDGQRLSLMPLAVADVSAGDRVSPGERIGSVAADGDDSTARTHLHVGLRHGSLYVDPMSVLSPPAPPEAARPVPGVPAGELAPATRPVATAPTAEPAGRISPNPASCPAARPVSVQVPRVTDVPVPGARTASAPDARMQPAGRGTAVSAEGSVVRAPATHAAAGPAAAAAGSSGPALVTSLPTLLRALRTRDRLVTTVVSYLLAAIAAAGCVAAVVRRSRTPLEEQPMLAAAVDDGD